MPRWHEEQYINHAKTLATQFAVSRRPLNELTGKFAQDHALNPDEIRTLVRLTNVAAFQELFARKNDGDKMVEFETGDPEVVIQNLIAEKAAPPTATVDSDKLASERAGPLPDLMRDIRSGFTLPPLEKRAYEDAPKPRRTPEQAELKRRQVLAEVRDAKEAAAMHWDDNVTKLVNHFKEEVNPAEAFNLFAKQAWALEPDAEVELTYVASALRCPLDNAKVASDYADRVLSSETKATRMLGALVKHRQTYERMKKASEDLATPESAAVFFTEIL